MYPVLIVKEWMFMKLSISYMESYLIFHSSDHGYVLQLKTEGMSKCIKLESFHKFSLYSV